MTLASTVIKDISIYSSGSTFVWRNETIFANLVEGIEKHFCEIILNLDQWFKRCF